MPEYDGKVTNDGRQLSVASLGNIRSVRLMELEMPISASCDPGSCTEGHRSHVSTSGQVVSSLSSPFQMTKEDNSATRVPNHDLNNSWPATPIEHYLDLPKHNHPLLDLNISDTKLGTIYWADLWEFEQLIQDALVLAHKLIKLV